jgi:hypothetical protein
MIILMQRDVNSLHLADAANNDKIIDKLAVNSKIGVMKCQKHYIRTHDA